MFRALLPGLEAGDPNAVRAAITVLRHKASINRYLRESDDAVQPEMKQIPIELLRKLVGDDDGPAPSYSTAPPPNVVPAINDDRTDSKAVASECGEVSFEFSRQFTIEELEEFRED